MRQHRLISIMFTLFILKSIVWCSSCSVTTQDNLTDSRIGTFSAPLRLDCQQAMFRQSQWSFNNNVLFVRGVSVTNKFEDTLIIFGNNSLLIKRVLLKHEGLYQCVMEQVTICSYLVTVTGNVI